LAAGHYASVSRPSTSRINCVASLPDIILPVSSGDIAVIILALSLRPSPNGTPGATAVTRAWNIDGASMMTAPTGGRLASPKVRGSGASHSSLRPRASAIQSKMSSGHHCPPLPRDRKSHHAERPAVGLHDPRRRGRKFGADQFAEQPDRKTAAFNSESFDEINVLILAQIDACRIGARSIGVGAMQVEHTGLYGRDRHRNFFASSEIRDDCLW
jgi:hypothetical protein